MKIAVLSDSHVAPRAQAFNANLSACVSWIRNAQPDLVLHLGDITADGMYDVEEFDLAASMLRRAERPVYVLPGNHDIGDCPAGPGAHNSHPLRLESLREFRQRLGSDWWSVSSPHWHLLGLNALLLGSDTEEEERQFAWLASQVRQATRPVGLTLHKPLFRNGPADTEVHERYVPLAARERLLELLKGTDLRFVLSGHVHQARRFKVGAVEHLWMPATSFCIPDVVQERIGEKTVGVGILELTADAYRFEIVSPPGVIRHNLMDHAEVYPVLTELRTKLGPDIAL